MERFMRIHTSLGHSLEVTPDHPMVRASGIMAKASDLKVGDTLLEETGQTITIENIQESIRETVAWNVLPQDETRAGNVLVAEGLLTGSARFQNQWANETYRLLLRENY